MTDASSAHEFPPEPDGRAKFHSAFLRSPVRGDQETLPDQAAESLITLTRKDIEELRLAVLKDGGPDLPFERASELAHQLMALGKIQIRPISEEEYLIFLGQLEGIKRRTALARAREEAGDI